MRGRNGGTMDIVHDPQTDQQLPRGNSTIITTSKTCPVAALVGRIIRTPGHAAERDQADDARENEQNEVGNFPPATNRIVKGHRASIRAVACAGVDKKVASRIRGTEAGEPSMATPWVQVSPASAPRAPPLHPLLPPSSSPWRLIDLVPREHYFKKWSRGMGSQSSSGRKMRFKPSGPLHVLSAAALFSLVATALGAPVLTNGNFETPQLASGAFTSNMNGTGWILEGGGAGGLVNKNAAGFLASPSDGGNQWCYLAPSTNGSLSEYLEQDIETNGVQAEKGKTINFSFEQYYQTNLSTTISSGHPDQDSVRQRHQQRYCLPDLFWIKRGPICFANRIFDDSSELQPHRGPVHRF